MLDTQEFADALRRGIVHSGLADGRSFAEAGYVSLAGAILEYLKSHIEVTVPAGAFQPAAGDGSSGTEVRCRIS